MGRISAGLCGVAGEYFVAAELSRRGYLATITLKNTENIDILASTVDGSKTVGVQVKTSQGGGTEWILSKKAEKLSKPNFFYVFVNLKRIEEPPEYFVVPSEKVAAYCSKFHKDWLLGKKKDGTARKDSDMRVFHDRDRAYLGAWHLLGLELPGGTPLNEAVCEPEGDTANGQSAPEVTPASAESPP